VFFDHVTILATLLRMSEKSMRLTDTKAADNVL